VRQWWLALTTVEARKAYSAGWPCPKEALPNKAVSAEVLRARRVAWVLEAIGTVEARKGLEVLSRDAESDPRGERMQSRPRLIVAGAVLLIGGLAVGLGLLREKQQQQQAIPQFGYEIVAEYPHDPTSFTQGLAIAEDCLYESTGHYGESVVRKFKLATMELQITRALGHPFFGEGATIIGDRLYVLTWKENTCFVFDRYTLEPRPELQFKYPWEGWGLTYDGKHLIFSDGSSRLRFLNPTDGKLVRELRVTSGGSPVKHLNELEYVEGEIFANVWHEDRIARISPETGAVVGWIDLKGLRPASTLNDEEAVLNGIAYDRKSKRLFVTGKNWPKLFEIRLVLR
jgi:glutamine cyclotransferase